MHIHVKYQVFPFHNDTIKSIAVQSSNDFLAFSGGMDSSSLKILPFSISPDYPSPEVHEKLSFTPPTPNSIFKKSISLLRWSPNDEYLATACETLLIYQRISRESSLTFSEFKNFNDHSLEVTAIAWSPDSQRLASSSLSHRIVVRDLRKPDETIEKILNLEHKVLGLIWDPLDKYLIGLCGDNCLRVWWVKGWEIFKTVNLSFSPGKQPQINSKREDRKIDFSPDFKYFLSPSLDDKIVPVVCALDRQDFEVKFTYMGPFSSINCIRFNPCLYEKSGSIINVFAMGDNDGNISVWSLGDQLLMDKPFFLFKAHSNGTELIEDLAWNSQGNLLMATTLKKYVSCILFDQENFGKPLNSKEICDFRKGLFGEKTLDIQHCKVKIWKGGRENVGFASFMGLDKRNEKGFGEGQREEWGKQEKNTKIVLTEQRTFVQNGKKIIVPQMQKVVEQEKEEKPNEIEKKPNENDKILINSDENHASFQQKNQDHTENNREENFKENLIIENSKEIKKPNSNNNENFIEIEDDVIINEQVPAKATKPTEKPLIINKKKKPIPQFPSKTLEISQPQLSEKDKVKEKPSEAEKNEKKHEKSSKIVVSHASPLKKLAKPKTTDLKSSLFLEKPKEKTPRKSQAEVNFCLKLPYFPIPEYFLVAIGPDRSLEFEKKGLFTQIRCVLQRNNSKETLWSDAFDGEIQLFEQNTSFLCFYTSKTLIFLVHRESGRRADLPLMVPDVKLLKFNAGSELLLLKSSGELRIWSIKTRKELLRENLQGLVKEHLANFPENRESYVEFVTLDSRGMPFVCLKPRHLYFFDAELKVWKLIDCAHLELGALENGDFSLKLANEKKSQRNPEKLANFFERLSSEDRGADFEERGALAKLEEKLNFFLFEKNWRNFEEILKKYVEKLLEKCETHKLRQIIVDLFVNEQRTEYIFLRESGGKEPKKLYQELIMMVMNFKGMEEIGQEIQQFIEISGCFFK